MSKVITMKATKKIKQGAKEPESAFHAEGFRQLLKTMRPYGVAWMASEVIGQLHEYTRDEPLSHRYNFKGYDYSFLNMHFELENMLDSGVLGYFHGDPPYKAEDDCAEDDLAS